ncbi:MAG: TonB family protein [Verrucomicrobiota bacterium]
MTINEYRKQHVQPKPTTPTPSRQISPVAPPRIDESFDVTDGSSTMPTGTTSSAEADFMARLLADLRAGFIGDGVATEGLSTTVAFSLRADGVLINLKLVTSSGSPAFDEAVLKTFRRVRAQGVPTGAVGSPYQIDFRVRSQ